MIRVYAGRIWRRINRHISRAWLSSQVRPQDIRLERFGTGHAAWWVPSDTKPGSVAYCGGVGQDASFDFALAEHMGMEVHSFDPTPSSIDYMARQNEGRIHFHPWGMLDRDETVRFHAPLDASHSNWFVDNLHGTDTFFEARCFTLKTIMEMLEHTEIALLKIDIEGSWGQVLGNMLENRIYPRTICVEFDSPAPLPRVRQTTRALQSAGYVLVQREHENCVFVRFP